MVHVIIDNERDLRHYIIYKCSTGLVSAYTYTNTEHQHCTWSCSDCDIMSLTGSFLWFLAGWYPKSIKSVFLSLFSSDDLDTTWMWPHFGNLDTMQLQVCHAALLRWLQLWHYPWGFAKGLGPPQAGPFSGFGIGIFCLPNDLTWCWSFPHLTSRLIWLNNTMTPFWWIQDWHILSF